MIKTLDKVGLEGQELNVIKAIKNPTQLALYSMVKSWELFPYDQEQDKDVYSHHFLFNIALEALVQSLH